MISKGILVLAEHDNHQLKRATANVVSAASQLPGEVVVLVVGMECEAVVEAVSHLSQVKRVLVCEAPSYAEGLAENIAVLVAEFGKAFSYVLAPATTYGKNILPRVAALLDVAQISEITRIIAEDTFVRPIYAGNALATIQSLDPIKVMTVRPAAFKAAPMVSSSAAPIQKLFFAADLKLSHFVTRKSSIAKGPELSSAHVVVAGGRGLQKGENFGLLEDIAQKLGGALGATRAAVDAGFVPNDYQIGQTGKIVAPDLYIAIGISGAIQHLAGMKDSKVIVAINKDPDAPIFQVANYGMVGDLFQILPELSQELAIRIDKT